MLYELWFENGLIVWKVAKSRNLTEILELSQKTTAQHVYILVFEDDGLHLIKCRCYHPSELRTASQLLI